MKKIISVICVISMMFLMTACGSQSSEKEHSGSSSESADNVQSEQTDNTQQNKEEGQDILVAYFSATGTTKTLAGYLSEVTGGDLYEIVPEEPYTSDDLNYSDNNSRSTMEQNDENARPAISGGLEDISQYDVIFLGYPIWWGEAPRIIYTFMESYDFAGKTIVPFCTSGGSGIGSSAQNLHELAASDINWLDGEQLDSGISHNEMVSWVNGLGLDVTAE